MTKKLTAAQVKHIAALTIDFESVEAIRSKNGFCNSNTLNVLRDLGLVEFMSTSTPDSFVMVRDHHWKLKAAA